MSTATATRGTEALEREQHYWEVMKNGDKAEIKKLTADPFLFVMSDGIMSFSRDDFANMMGGGDFTLKSYRIDTKNAQVRPIGSEGVMVAYPAHMEFERGGKAGTSDTYYASTWIKEGGRWVCGATTETPMPAGKR